MSSKNQEIQDQILLGTLEGVPFDGWCWPLAEEAAVKSGYSADVARAVFPEGLPDLMRHFSDWADRQMLEALKSVDQTDMRIRDRIKKAVATRFEILEPYKESVHAASVYWLSPFRKLESGKIIWRSADKIWLWAGDDAKDYNHYTKRALLSAVMASTTIAWLDDKSENHQETLAFLDRRIDNVLTVGKLAGKIKNVMPRKNKAATQKG